MQNSPKKLSVGFLFDDTLDSTDGVAQHVKLVGAWFSSRGHNVIYIVGQTRIKEWSGGKVVSLARNLNVSFNGNRLSMPIYVKQRDVKHLLKSDFDVLHVMAPYSPLMSQQIIRRAPATTAIVGTFHIYPSGWLSSIGARLLRLVQIGSLRRINKFISVSQPAQNFAKDAFRVDSVVIPNPVDLKLFKSTHPSKNKERQRIVFLGRLVKRKGCRELIEAFKVLRSRLPSAELIIAGDGPERTNLEQLVKESGIEKNVKFLGFISETEKPGLLASADVACFPSLYGESFGIVLIEAMAAGAKTVLGGDNAGYRSVLGERNELLVDPKNTRSLASSLYNLLADKDLINSVHNWQEKKIKDYDINVVGLQIEAVYLNAIARLGKKSHN